MRLSNAFGVPVHKDVNCWMLLVNDLCKQAVQTGRLVLQTSGLQQRDFIGLNKVCRVVERFLVGHDEFKQTNIFNVGSGISQSVRTMAQLIQQRCTHVLNFEPLLQHVKAGINEQNPNLTYRHDKLDALGINFDALDNTAEIDILLRFCNSTFT